MANITAAMVKELRTKSGAGMMDCKKALAETDGDIEAAVDWLRKKGLAAAQKKSGRVAADGLIGVAVEGTKGVLVEVNSETDFVARNETFQEFVQTFASIALTNEGDMARTLGAAYPDTDRTVEGQITHNIATIGENMSARRAELLSVEAGRVVPYIHGSVANGLGKIGVLVALQSEGDAAALDSLGKHIAMHVAATAPQSLSRDDLDPAIVDRERQVLIDQARQSGKPENIIEKMIEGRLKKFYQEVVLLEQTSVVDPDRTIGKVVEDTAKELGSPVTLTAFARFALGEGIEKEESDFAAEVAAAVAS